MGDKMLALLVLCGLILVGYLVATNFMFLMQWFIFPAAVIYALSKW